MPSPQYRLWPEVAMSDTRFMSAKEKERVLKQWGTFLKHGCRREHFTKTLYDHLNQHCSFIAHYDRGGFYATYFENGDDTAHFLTQFDKRGDCQSVEYGGTGWMKGEYSDVNRAMVEVAAQCAPQLMEQALQKQRTADIITARALLAKHGITVNID